MKVITILNTENMIEKTMTQTIIYHSCLAFQKLLMTVMNNRVIITPYTLTDYFIDFRRNPDVKFLC